MRFAKSRPRVKRVKMRGRKTCGWGAKKKRRGGGSRGGKGFAGMFDQKRVWRIVHAPERIGKYGFKSLKQRNISPTLRAINLRDIAKLTDQAEIELAKFGYDKVLSAGNISKPVTIKAKAFSEAAVKKIEAAGGKAVKI